MFHSITSQRTKLYMGAGNETVHRFRYALGFHDSIVCRILSRQQNRKNAGLPLDKPEKNAYNKNRKSIPADGCSHINGKRLKEITAAIARGAVISFYDCHGKLRIAKMQKQSKVSRELRALTKLRNVP